MLKHTSPMKISPSPTPPQSPLNLEYDPIKGTCRQVVSDGSPHHRRSHSDDLIPMGMAEDKAVYQVGLWQGVSQASVRRGLSFNSRRAPDSLSFRSVRSEGRGVLHVSSSPSKHSNNAMSLTSLKGEAPSFKTDLKNFKGEILSLKSLLKLPGIRGHARIVENARSSTSSSKSQLILSPDTLSLASADSCFSNNTSGRTSSRSWSSNTSSNDSGNTSNSESSGSNDSTSEPTSTTLKVFAKCLRSDIEYKTISVSSRATCREVVATLLTKYRMKHRDPNLFYLTMEVTVRRWSGLPVRSLLVLEEGARPAQLALCRPPGDCKFVLQMRKGGILRIHDTVLYPGSQYKSLLVSARTTSEEVVQLLLNCYDRNENKHNYALHEVRRNPEYSDRYLRPDERPLEVKATWPRDRQSEFIFVLRRNMTQALCLRKLSMRNLQLNKQILAETCQFKDPKAALQCGVNPLTRQTSGTVCVASIVGVAKKASPPPANNAKQPPVQPIRSKSCPPKTQEKTCDQDFDEAVIDCTDVLPKMVTISRRTSPQSKNTTDLFSSKKSDSLSPTAYTQVIMHTQPTPYNTTTTTTTIIPQNNNVNQQVTHEANISTSDAKACVNTGTQTQLTLKSRSGSLKSLNCTSSTDSSNKSSTGTQAEESSSFNDTEEDIPTSQQNNCVEYVNISPAMVASNTAHNNKSIELVQIANITPLTACGSKTIPTVEFNNEVNACDSETVSNSEYENQSTTSESKSIPTVEYINLPHYGESPIPPPSLEYTNSSNTGVGNTLSTVKSSSTYSKSIPAVEYINLPSYDDSKKSVSELDNLKSTNDSKNPVSEVHNTKSSDVSKELVSEVKSLKSKVEYVNLPPSPPSSPKKSSPTSLLSTHASQVHEYVNLTPTKQTFSASSDSPPSYQAPSPPSYQAPSPPSKASESPPSYHAPHPPLKFDLGPPIYPAPSPPVPLPTVPLINQPIPDLNASTVITQVIARHLNGSTMSQNDISQHSFFSHGENSTVIPANSPKYENSPVIPANSPKYENSTAIHANLPKYENTVKEVKNINASDSKTEIRSNNDVGNTSSLKCKHKCQHEHCFYI